MYINFEHNLHSNNLLTPNVTWKTPDTILVQSSPLDDCHV